MKQNGMMKENFLLSVFELYSKTCEKRPLSKDGSLMLVESIAECSKGEHSAILSTFVNLPIVMRSLLCLFLRGGFTQVLLYHC